MRKAGSSDAPPGVPAEPLRLAIAAIPRASRASSPNSPVDSIIKQPTPFRNKSRTKHGRPIHYFRSPSRLSRRRFYPGDGSIPSSAIVQWKKLIPRINIALNGDTRHVIRRFGLRIGRRKEGKAGRATNQRPEYRGGEVHTVRDYGALRVRFNADLSRAETL